VPIVAPYAARLSRLVERDCARIRRIHGRPKRHRGGGRVDCRGKRGTHAVSWEQIYGIITSLDPQPVDYRRVAEILDVGDPRTLWRIASHLRGLERRGYLRVVGRGTARRSGRGSAKLYRVASRTSSAYWSGARPCSSRRPHGSNPRSKSQSASWRPRPTSASSGRRAEDTTRVRGAARRYRVPCHTIMIGLIKSAQRLLQLVIHGSAGAWVCLGA
jgi:hypothetical protein